MAIEHFSHGHSFKISKLNESHYCRACSLPMGSPAYTSVSPVSAYSCVNPSCHYDLHKSCFELPRQKASLLHPHLLTLSTKPPNGKESFKCDQCRDICYGFTYNCSVCQFNLDINCATLNQSMSMMLKEGKIKTKIFVSVHNHALSLFNCKEEFQVKCEACHLNQPGPAYCCLKCKFFIHESCTKYSNKVVHPFHEHPLRLAFGTYCYYIDCRVCLKTKNTGFYYYCEQCDFCLNIECANLSTSVIKLERHEHKLLFYETDDLDTSFHCRSCRMYCRGAFYRCVDCDFNLHSQCVPIPEEVKHDHIHLLTYTMPNATDDSRLKEYYCHFCETERDPKFPFYNCYTCPYTAHIGCVVSEGSAIIGKVDRKVTDISEEEEPNGGITLGKIDKPGVQEIKREISSVKAKIALETTVWKAIKADVDQKRAELDMKRARVEELAAQLKASEIQYKKVTCWAGHGHPTSLSQ